MWASGNGGGVFDSCATNGFISSIYTIGIGSAASDGLPAYYDEQCSGKMAVVFVNNPHYNVSNDVVSFQRRDRGIYTIAHLDYIPKLTTHISSTQIATTADGGCNEEFDGTSAACPLVSGVMALLLEAK